MGYNDLVTSPDIEKEVIGEEEYFENRNKMPSIHQDPRGSERRDVMATQILVPLDGSNREHN